MSLKTLQIIQALVVLNFIISVMLLMSGTLLSFSEHYSLFDFKEDLYGELVLHLKITMLYIAITEVIVCAFSITTKKAPAIALAGFFLVLMMGSLHFYGQINDVELDENLPLFFLYTGVSHMLFGVSFDLKAERCRFMIN